MPEIRPVAHIDSPFTQKFGIPRQSGLVAGVRARVLFEPPYRSGEAVRGLGAFSHIWLVWGFSQLRRGSFAATVRPPRLGGNARMGVFATRSPYRPNALGLSCVRLERVEAHPTLGPVLHVSGADLLCGTPIFDIKPYLPYTDCRPEAVGGFADDPPRASLAVHIPGGIAAQMAPDEAAVLRELLAADPRPPYQCDPGRVYGMAYGGAEVRFSVAGGTLTVLAYRKEGE